VAPSTWRCIVSTFTWSIVIWASSIWIVWGAVLVCSEASELLAAEYCCCIEASWAAAWSLLCWAFAVAVASATFELSSVAWCCASVSWSVASLA